MLLWPEHKMSFSIDYVGDGCSIDGICGHLVSKGKGGEGEGRRGEGEEREGKGEREWQPT